MSQLMCCGRNNAWLAKAMHDVPTEYDLVMLCAQHLGKVHAMLTGMMGSDCNVSIKHGALGCSAQDTISL